MLYIVVLLLVIGYFYLLDKIGRIERALERGEYKQGSSVKPAPSTAPVQAETKMQVPKAPVQPVVQMTATKPKVKHEYKSTEDKHLEVKIGSKLFTGIGAIAIIFGVGFFLRYAFENNLITETLRVVLGLIGGGVLLLLGWFTHKKYATYGQIVTGGGIGLLYLSLYSAFNFYNLISQPVAFSAMIIVTAAAIGLALVYDSLPLAGFALFGGFITPFLLADGTANPHALFIYIAILDIGLLAIARFKNWQEIILGSLIGTFLVYLSWAFRFYTDAQFTIALTYTTVFFAIFLLTLAINQTYKHHLQKGVDVFLTFFVPILYFAQNYLNFEKLYPEATFYFALFIAIIYLALGIVFRMLDEEERTKRYSQILFAVATIFFVVSVPIQFSGYWITIGWATQAALLVLLGVALDLRIVRFFGVATFLLVAFRLMFFESTLAADATAWLNKRLAVYLFSFVASALVAGYLEVKRRMGFFERQEDAVKAEYIASLNFLIIMSYMFALVGIALEVNAFQEPVWLSIMLSLFGLGAAAVSFGLNNVFMRVISYTVFGLALLHVVFKDGNVVLSSYTPFFNSRIVAALILAACLFGFGLMLRQFREMVDREEYKSISVTLFVAINGLLLWMLSVEVLDFFNKQLLELTNAADRTEIVRIHNIKRASLSVVWLLYAITMLVVGLIRNSNRARQFSVVLLGIVIFKVFLYDTANLDDFYRFISFIALGVILLLSGFLYYRYKERIEAFIEGGGSQNNTSMPPQGDIKS